MLPDPIVAEVRRHRRRYALRFKHDLRAMFEDLKQLERTMPERVVNLSAPRRRRRAGS